MMRTQEESRNNLNKLFEALRQRFGGKCWDCGSVYDLQFAHVNDTGLTGSGRGKKKDIITSLIIYLVTNFFVKHVIGYLIMKESETMMTLNEYTVVSRGKSG